MVVQGVSTTDADIAVVLTPAVGVVGVKGMYDGQSVTMPGFSTTWSAQMPMRY